MASSLPFGAAKAGTAGGATLGSSILGGAAALGAGIAGGAIAGAAGTARCGIAIGAGAAGAGAGCAAGAVPSAVFTVSPEIMRVNSPGSPNEELTGGGAGAVATGVKGAGGASRGASRGTCDSR